MGTVSAAAPTDFQRDWFCTHIFWERMIFIQQPLTPFTHDFHSEVILLSVFQGIFENLHPQFWNPNMDPASFLPKQGKEFQSESTIDLANINPNQGGLFGPSKEWGGVESAHQTFWALSWPFLSQISSNLVSNKDLGHFPPTQTLHNIIWTVVVP